MKSRNPVAGFSLLELLISLAILSLVMIALTGILGTGTRVWEASNKLKQVADQAVVRNRIRLHIEQLPLPNAYVPALNLFRGDTNTLFFSIPGPNLGLADARNFDARLFVTEDQGAQSLRFVVKAGQSIAEQAIVASGLKSVSISYYGSRTPNEPKQWYNAWASETMLPKLVKIVFETKTGQLPPPLAIRPAKITIQSRISLSSLVPPD